MMFSARTLRALVALGAFIMDSSSQTIFWFGNTEYDLLESDCAGEPDNLLYQPNTQEFCESNVATCVVAPTSGQFIDFDCAQRSAPALPMPKNVVSRYIGAFSYNSDDSTCEGTPFIVTYIRENGCSEVNAGLAYLLEVADGGN